LNSSEHITLRQYYLSFKSISGVMAGLLSAIPFLSKLAPDAYAAYGFPPLGSLEGPARIGTFVFAWAATYFAFFARAGSPSGDRKRIAAAMVFAFVFLCLYFGLFLRFVRTIEIPAKNISVQVSVGYERTDFAKDNFGAASDWEILRARGTGEEEIWKLWTTKSLLVCRLSLYIAYSIVVLSLVAAFSWGVIYQFNLSKP
jgi:hypothetical protein